MRKAEAARLKPGTEIVYSDRPWSPGDGGPRHFGIVDYSTENGGIRVHYCSTYNRNQAEDWTPKNSFEWVPYNRAEKRFKKGRLNA